MSVPAWVVSQQNMREIQKSTIVSRRVAPPTQVLVTYNAAKANNDVRARVEHVTGSQVVYTEYSASCRFSPVERTVPLNDFLYSFRPVRSGE